MKTYYYQSTTGLCSPFLDTDYLMLGVCESQYGAWAAGSWAIGSLRYDCAVSTTSSGESRFPLGLTAAISRSLALFFNSIISSVV